MLKVLPQTELLEQFLSLKGCRMGTIGMRTEPKLVKPKSNPLAGRVVKYQSVNGALGFDYAKAVDRQLDKEGKEGGYNPADRPNMTHMGGCVLKHKKTGEYYIFLRPLSKSEPVYYVDGQLTPLDSIRRWLYFPPKKSGGGIQGTDKEVPYINVKLENITHVSGLTKGGVAVQG